MSTDSKPDTPSPAEFESETTKVKFGKVDYSGAQGMRFYANHVASNATLFDIRLILSDVDVLGDGVRAVQSLVVLMSPELARLLQLTLEKTLSDYNKSYGPDRLPLKLPIGKMSASGAAETPEDPKA